MAEKLRVLMINGSPRANGNTSVGLKEMEKIFQENGVEVETVVVGNKPVQVDVLPVEDVLPSKNVFMMM